MPTPDIREWDGWEPPEACELRNAMVREQLAGRGVADARVLDAMRGVPRHLFCRPGTPLADAYDDFPLPVGCGQTISQPWMVADMLERLELKGGETVLEVGTGSGYNAALLSRLAQRVVSMEIVPELAAAARRRLRELGFAVEIVEGDGSAGWPPAAPYDAIVVTAGAPEVPPPLLEQLAEGGRLVIPVGGRDLQELTVIRRHGSLYAVERACGCRFVPLTGRHGWFPSGARQGDGGTP